MSDSLNLTARSVGFWLLAVFILIIYSNSFNASWHLDDYANILHNPKLHLKNLEPANLKQTFFAMPGGEPDRLYRPVACLSLALNWYFGGSDVVGYHMVNLAIHGLAAFFLFRTILLFFVTPRLKNSYETDKTPYFIALLATTLWAIHPIQTQAVTYIVQRMAQLAGMFYFAGLFFYLKGRISVSRKSKAVYWGLCACAFLLGVGSKENAVVFPFSLILIEGVFFGPPYSFAKRKRVLLASMIVGAIAIGVILVLLIGEDTISRIFEAYGLRDFNHRERLLTEFRVLWFYLGQIAYPIPGKLSVEHDITISSGLLTPWTTLPAILATLAAIGAAIYAMPRVPFISFGVLFFFLTHVIESSILPLEIIFEHRNYIPSAFLFLAPAAGIHQLITIYKKRSSAFYWFLVGVVCLLLTAVGMGAHSRNIDWLSEKSLWEDVLRKAPGSARAHHNLAWEYYSRVGQKDTAIAFYEKSLQLKAHRKTNRSRTLTNIANFHYLDGEYEKAIAIYLECVALYPENVPANLRLAHSYIQLNRWKDAFSTLEQLMEAGIQRSDVASLKGYIALHLQKPETALRLFREVLRKESTHWAAMVGVGHSYGVLGDYDRGDFFMRIAEGWYPSDPFIKLNRADLSLKAGKREKAENLIHEFLAANPSVNMSDYLRQVKSLHIGYPLAYPDLVALIAKSLSDSAEDLLFEHTPAPSEGRYGRLSTRLHLDS